MGAERWAVRWAERGGRCDGRGEVGGEGLEVRGLTLDHVAHDKLARIDFDNLQANVNWNSVAKSTSGTWPSRTTFARDGVSALKPAMTASTCAS